MKSERLEFVQKYIVKIQTFLLSGDEIRSLTDDSGQSITYDRDGAWKRLQELQREEANLLNPKRYRKHINLSDAFGN